MVANRRATRQQRHSNALSQALSRAPLGTPIPPKIQILSRNSAQVLADSAKVAGESLRRAKAAEKARSEFAYLALIRTPLVTPGPVRSETSQVQSETQLPAARSQVLADSAKVAGEALQAKAAEGAARRDSAFARELESETEGSGMETRKAKYESDKGFENVFAEPGGSALVTRRGRVADIQETPYTSAPVSLQDYVVSKPNKIRDAGHSKVAADALTPQPVTTTLHETPEPKLDEDTDRELEPEPELSASPTHHYIFTFPTSGLAELPDPTTIEEPMTSTVRKITHSNGDISAVELSPSGKRWIELGKVTAASTSTSPEREKYLQAQQPEQPIATSQSVTGYTRRPIHLAQRNSEDDIRTFQNAWATATARNSNNASNINLRRTVMHDPLSTTTSAAPAISTALPTATVTANMDYEKSKKHWEAGLARIDAAKALANSTHGTAFSDWSAFERQPRNPWVVPYDPTTTGSVRPFYARASSGLLLSGQRLQAQQSSLTDDELRAYVPPGSHASADKVYIKEASVPKAADLNTFWNSGRVNQARQQEFIDHHLAASGKTADDSAQAAMGVFVPMYENLLWYASQKSTLADPRIQASRNAIGGYPGSAAQPIAPLRGKDYFARFGEPPEWCIDRSMTLGQSTLGIGKGGLPGQKVQTFFGELEWTKAPERVGRDIRYRPLPSMSGSDLRKGPKMSGGIGLPGIGGRKDSGLGMGLGRFG